MKKFAILMAIVMTLMGVVVFCVCSVFSVAHIENVNEKKSNFKTNPDPEADLDAKKGISIQVNSSPDPGPRDIIDEEIFRKEFESRLSSKPRYLASFLLVSGRLKDFVRVDSLEDPVRIINKAVVVFTENEVIRQQAIELAKEIFASSDIDCNWENLNKDYPTTDDMPYNESGSNWDPEDSELPTPEEPETPKSHQKP